MVTPFLQRFSERTGVSMNSLSRFELGKQVPRDPVVLHKLQGVCVSASASGPALLAEESLFRDARLEVEGIRRIEEAHTTRYPEIYPGRLLEFPRSLGEWRYLVALKIAPLYFPEIQPALEKALAPALGTGRRSSQHGRG